jgi:hypothetical protein
MAEDIIDDGSANDGLTDDSSAESANDLIDGPDKGVLPRDLFDMFVNDQDGHDGDGSNGSAGDWWFDSY